MTKFDSDYWIKAQQKLEFAGNYQGPLYAPHPDLVAKRNTTEERKPQSKA